MSNLGIGYKIRNAFSGSPAVLLCNLVSVPKSRDGIVEEHPDFIFPQCFEGRLPGVSELDKVERINCCQCKPAFGNGRLTQHWFTIGAPKDSASFSTYDII